MLEQLSRELRRKAFHLTGCLIPVIYYFISRETALILLSFINAILLLIEWFRLKGKIEIPKILLRPHEEKKVAGYIYFQISALLSILVFDKAIAIAALLMLAIGDTASGLAGAVIRGGDIRNNNVKAVKPFPIMALMFSVCILIGFALTFAPGIAHLSPRVYIAGALGATLGDSVPLRISGKTLDDNLIIPLLSGIFMTAAA